MIDAVITWVNGDDPIHEKKRRTYMAEQGNTSWSQNTAAQWKDSDEISICVRSIELYAPWIRKIWIVTDNQEPCFSMVSKEFRKRITIIDHSEIFQEYRYCLPVFNSLAIGTLLFRIPGLSRKFIYFNDDVFLMGNVTPADFFTASGGLVLRGKLWPDLNKECAGELPPHKIHQLNGARMIQAQQGSFFPAHFTQPFCRVSAEKLFDRFKELFERNIEFRFRDTTQFSMASLCANYFVESGNFMIKPKKDYFQITAEVCSSGSSYQVNKSFRRLMKRSVKLGCINDAASLSQRFPEAYDRFRDTFSDDQLKRLRAKSILCLKTSFFR